MVTLHSLKCNLAPPIHPRQTSRQYGNSKPLNARSMRSVYCETLVRIHALGRRKCVSRAILGRDREPQLGHGTFERGPGNGASGHRLFEERREYLARRWADFEDLR